MSTIYVTGHKNPDLDSVCSAYGYASFDKSCIIVALWDYWKLQMLLLSSKFNGCRVSVICSLGSIPIACFFFYKKADLLTLPKNNYGKVYFLYMK